jgi:hypothetical protein
LFADTEYVSGESEINVKLPVESVFAVTDCDGLLATTVAFEIGAPVSALTTVPLIRPVVPASAHVTWQSIPASSRTATSARFAQYRGIMSSFLLL